MGDKNDIHEHKQDRRAGLPEGSGVQLNQRPAMRQVTSVEAVGLDPKLIEDRLKKRAITSW